MPPLTAVGACFHGRCTRSKTVVATPTSPVESSSVLLAPVLKFQNSPWGMDRRLQGVLDELI